LWKAEKSLVVVESIGEVKTLLLTTTTGTKKAGNQISESFSQTIVKLELRLVAESTPFWIYIVSGGGGILLLVLISVCLYKVRLCIS
jgi:hypothetical protein